MKNQNILTAEQARLIDELVNSYNIEPDDVKWFVGETRPFIGYEATAVIANHLVPALRGIGIENIEGHFPDSVGYRCTLTFDTGHIRSAVGIANINETDSGDKKLSEQQVYYLASSRALRNALRMAGIDLIKLHNAKKFGQPEYSGPHSATTSNYDNLVKQAHALGEETGFIKQGDKSSWRTFLKNRYDVVSVNNLNEELLADLVAVLSSFRNIKNVA